MVTKVKILTQYERLVRRRELLLETLSLVPMEVLQRRPDEQKWSVLQILYHVHLAEKGTLGYINKKLVHSPGGLPNASWLSGVRTVTLQITLVLPLKFKAPAGLGDVPALPDLNDIVSEWESTTRGFYNLFERLEVHQLRWQLFKHPFIGRLDMADTIKFMHSHFAHHEKQIARLIS